MATSNIIMAATTNPLPKSTSWDFTGQAVFYYQTTDGNGRESLFQADTNKPGFAKGATGLQLLAINRDIIDGIGAGIELSGISDAGLFPDIIEGFVQDAGNVAAADNADSIEAASALTQAYLTYGIANTSVKIGRQRLPKSLSPFAYSEGWNVFKNTFDAGVVVNSDLQETVLVGAVVSRKNNSIGNLNTFTKLYNSKFAYMITAQNKSIDGFTLTGSYYTLPNATATGDAMAAWIDAKFKVSNISIALQGGMIGGNGVANDTTAFGAKVATTLSMFDVSLAYSTVDDGTLNIANLAGAGVKSPLYTQAILNQNTIKRDSNTVKATASMKALDGKVSAIYIHSDLGATALESLFGTGTTGAGRYQEAELLYQTTIAQNTKIFTAYIYQNDDRQGTDDSQNFVRVWVRYNF